MGRPLEHVVDELHAFGATVQRKQLCGYSLTRRFPKIDGLGNPKF
jgi:hypothetical protein